MIHARLQQHETDVEMVEVRSEFGNTLWAVIHRDFFLGEDYTELLIAGEAVQVSLCYKGIA